MKSICSRELSSSGTDAARVLEELGGDLDSVDQLHSQGMELAEVDADEEWEELMGPAALCPRCGQQQVDCICAPSRPVAQEPEGEWEPGMGLGGGAAVLEGPPPCPLMQRAIELGVLGLSTRHRNMPRAVPATSVDVITPGTLQCRRAWLQFAGQTDSGVKAAASLFGGEVGADRRDGNGYVVYRCYWPDAPAGEPWTALPQGATDRLIVHHSGRALLLPDRFSGKVRREVARQAASWMWWRECDARGHTVGTGRVWGSARPLWVPSGTAIAGHNQLLVRVDANDTLPPGWVEVRADGDGGAGSSYFWHAQRGISQWVRPVYAIDVSGW